MVYDSDNEDEPELKVTKTTVEVEETTVDISNPFENK